MNSTYGEKLNPYRKYREPLGIKGVKQSVVTTHNPSVVDQGDRLTVRFPNLGRDDVIVPGTVKLAFEIELESEDPNRTVVQNLGRAIVKEITIKLDSREIFSLTDSDIFYTYVDLWLSKNERDDLAYQGIQSELLSKSQLGAQNGANTAANASIQAIVKTYRNRFYIPLDFEILTCTSPFLQSALNDRLSYELVFNDYKRVVMCDKSDGKYKISGISLEYDIVTNPELAGIIRRNYDSKAVIYYDRILRHRREVKNKADTVWNFNLNTPARSFKGILMLFQIPNEPFERKSEEYYNPLIKHVSLIIEGKPNQLYASGLLPYQHFDEIRKFLGGGRLRNPTVDLISKDLHVHDVRLDEYLTNKYGLWLDFRTTDDSVLHGSGRRIEGSDGVTIQVHKEKTADSPVDVYIFIVSDAQINLEKGRLNEVMY